MIQLGPISYTDIQHWLPDFYKRANNYDTPQNEAQYVGVFSDGVLAGYFVVMGYLDGDLEIVQGYWSKPYRHKNLSKQAMILLETKAKSIGYKRILLASSRSLKAYTRFMKNLGYTPTRIIFSKEI